MKKAFVAVVLSLVPSLALAAPITFDLRNPAIEAIDEQNAFPLTQDGLTAFLQALPTTFDGRNVLLNQTSSSFGINVEGTTCGSMEESAQVDGGCTGESISILFSQDVFVNTLRLSLFGSADVGTATVGGTSFTPLASGINNLGDTFLAAGTQFLIAYNAGNGFSVDNFTVTVAPTAVPEPATLSLLTAGLLAASSIRRRRRA